MPQQSLSNTCVFSVKHITGSLCLVTLDRSSALHLGAILNREITHKKHKNVKNLALNIPRKGHLFTV